MTDNKRSAATATPASKKAQKAQTSKRRSQLSQADQDWVVPQALKRGYARPRAVEEGDAR